MSDFHGGFFVRSTDAVVAEPIRLALIEGLRERGIDLVGNTLTFAVRRGCPVMHVAVRGLVGDGKDYAFFHHRHSDLGADVARAAGVEVWAYHYENQAGSESVRAFRADGSERSNVYCDWDDLTGSDDGDDGSNDDDENDDAMSLDAAPLGVLATELGISRGVLEHDLGYDTETVRVGLSGGPCTEAVVAYLASPLRAAHLPVKPEPGFGGPLQGLYFPTWMIEELEAHARRLDVSVGLVAWAIWEAAKSELFRTVPIAEADQAFGGPATKPARHLVPPPSEPPTEVVVPRLVPVFAKSLPVPPSNDDKVLLNLALPPQVLEEIQRFATETDHSLSWSMQKAYAVTRGRIHAAEKHEV